MKKPTLAAESAICTYVYFQTSLWTAMYIPTLCSSGVPSSAFISLLPLCVTALCCSGRFQHQHVRIAVLRLINTAGTR
jgi:hypothetical protein